MMLRLLEFFYEKGVFLHLFNLSVSASFLVFAVIVLRFLLKKAPKWSICLLWGLVGLRLVFPFSIESIFSLIPSAETVSPDILYEAEPVIDSGITAVDNIVNPILVQNFAPALGYSANPMQGLLAVLTAVWLLGVVAMLVYMFGGYIFLRFRLRTAVKMTDNIFQSEKVSSPFIFGTVRPRIYLPFAMDESDMEYVIAHEKAHLLRFDHLTKIFAYLILSVYWFNPLLGVAYILLCRDIELACDEKVVREMETEQKKAYSLALLKCSMNKKTHLACPLAFGEVGVKTRVKNVMHYKKPAFWIILLAVVAIVVTAVCFLTVPKEKGAKFLFYRPVKIVGEDAEFSVNANYPVSLQKYYMMLSTGGGFFEWNEYSNAWNSMADGNDDFDNTTKIGPNKYAMEGWFSEKFIFEGDRYGEDYLNLDNLYIGTKSIYSFEYTDKNSQKWINYLFHQTDGGLYWGCGLAEDGYIRVLCELEPMESPTESSYNIGYYEAVEDIGLHASVSANRPFCEYPYYYIDGTGRLFSQKQGETSWAFLGELSELDITEARVTASRLLTMPFTFNDESGTDGNSAIRNAILSGISDMWTLTTTENEVEWTYYFIQVGNGAMYFGQGQGDAMFWLYRMERIAEYETDTKPQISSASIVSARAMRADMEVKASNITIDDQTVRFKVSFENLSEDTSLYYNGNCVLGKIVSEGHDKRIEWQDGGAPFFMGHTAVSRVFVIDGALLEDGQYRLHIFFALESGDFNIENAPCAEIVFELQNFK